MIIQDSNVHGFSRCMNLRKNDIAWLFLQVTSHDGRPIARLHDVQSLNKSSCDLLAVARFVVCLLFFILFFYFKFRLAVGGRICNDWRGSQ